MKAFYGAKLSPHLTETPEGFLVCHGVPICRTGTQKYLPAEIGASGSGLVDVYRSEAEVFKPAAMASFEGKPVTDDHPPGEVNSGNYGAYTRGTVQNVRKGTGEEADYVVCDLVIFDAVLIDKIKHGKREVSCGYDCKYIDNGNGTYTQADIIGNHVAIVDQGRAGKEVSIRDSKPIMKGRDKMARNIWERMFGAFVKDAEPAEVLEAAKAVDKACGKDEASELKETAEVSTRDEDMEMVVQAIHELNEKLEAIKTDLKGHYKEDKAEGEELNEKLSGLDAVEAAIKESVTDSEEENVEVNPEVLNDEEPEEVKEEVKVVEPEGAGSEKVETEAENKTKDRAISLAMLRAIKPIVASMPKEQRKFACDALSRAVKQASTQPLTGGYGSLLKRKNTMDTAALQASQRAFGENCRKRNPHVK